MGDRAQVLIKDEGVYLYTHWGGSNIQEVVRQALAKRWRWDDPEYLARIIFCEMIKGAEVEETGFGIGTSEHGDIWRLIEVDSESKIIRVIDNHSVTLEQPFEEFIKTQLIK